MKVSWPKGTKWPDEIESKPATDIIDIKSIFDLKCKICGRAEQEHSPVDSCCKGFTMTLAPPKEEI